LWTLQGAELNSSTYAYELTTNSFRVDSEGFLVVNDPNLDRDPPNQPKLSFQVSFLVFAKLINRKWYFHPK
jgi:hypothetical protein